MRRFLSLQTQLVIAMVASVVATVAIALSTTTVLMNAQDIEFRAALSAEAVAAQAAIAQGRAPEDDDALRELLAARQRVYGDASVLDGTVLGGIAAASSLLGGLLGVGLARRLGRPLGEVSPAARRVAAGDLGARAAPTGALAGETRHLVDNFNAMCGALEGFRRPSTGLRRRLHTTFTNAPDTWAIALGGNHTGPGGDDDQENTHMRMLFAAAALSMAGLAGAAHAQAMMAEMALGGDPALTIAQNVAASPVHASLAAALDAAGLTKTLGGAGPYTLLAPSGNAFAALETGLLDTMMLPENKEALAGVLLCHAVDGTLVTGDLAQMTADRAAGPEGVEIETLGGCVLTAQATPEGGVTVTDERGTVARVVVPDVMQANGVIHVIDAVLKPAGM